MDDEDIVIDLTTASDDLNQDLIFQSQVVDNLYLPGHWTQIAGCDWLIYKNVTVDKTPPILRPQILQSAHPPDPWSPMDYVLILIVCPLVKIMNELSLLHLSNEKIREYPSLSYVY